MPKLYHVVMPHDTTTFLTQSDRDTWLDEDGGALVDIVTCESEITSDQMMIIREWRKEMGIEDDV